MSSRRKIIINIGILASFLTLIGAAIGISVICAVFLYISPQLPSVDRLKDVQLQEPLRVYSRDNKLLAEFGEKRRIPLSIDNIPQQVKQAFLAAEDDRFEEHPGVDYQGLLRAVINQVLKGDRAQGGSTITMQVARNFFLSREKTYIRKINEIFLALKIEEELSKGKILELYLNKIYLGKRAYGVEAAARVYYGKTIDELSLPQVAMIAGLPKAPSTYNPVANPQRALIRRNYVLSRMRDLQMIEQSEYDAAIAVPVTASTHEVQVDVQAPYVAEMVRADVLERYGEEIYSTGMKIYTTIDAELQRAANKALQNGLLDYEARHGYRGPIQRWEIPEAIQQTLEQIVVMPAVDESVMAAEEQVSQTPDETPGAAIDSDTTASVAAEGESGKVVSVDTETIPDDEVAAEAAKAAALAEGRLLEVTAEEVQAVLDGIGYFGNIYPALVTRLGVEETPADAAEKSDEAESLEYAEIYTSIDGEAQSGELARLYLRDLAWAKPFITLDQQGPEPTAISDVVKAGDLVWLRRQQDPKTKVVRWALAELPKVEGALVALDPADGSIVALVGGYDYFKSKFNRAVQAKRQAGSGFKPFLYTAALENGFTAASIINDAPVVFDDPALEGKWRPENYSGKFFGPTRLREGLVKSRNLVSIRLLIELGINRVRRFANQFGFELDQLPKDLSLALGSGTVTPLDMVAGFAVFANGGYRVQPYYTDRIEDGQGKVLWMADYQLACLQCFVDQLSTNALPQYEIEWPPAPETELPQEQSDPVLQATQANIGDDVVAVHAEDAFATQSDTQSAATNTDTTDSVEPAESVQANTEDANVENANTENANTENANTENEVIADALASSAEELVELPLRRRLTQAEQVLQPDTHYIASSMLRDVVRRGTGRRALSIGRNDLAGKTGTTNDQHDAWFNGFNHRYVATAWVGYDSHIPLGAREAGARAALPIWIDFMRAALQGVPEESLIQPDNIATLRIDPESGLLASATTLDAVLEVFKMGTEPTEEADSQSIEDFIYEGEDGTVSAEPEDLF